MNEIERYHANFLEMYRGLVFRIMDHGEEVEVGEWQSQDVRDKPHMVSRELRHVRFELHSLPVTVERLQQVIKPNLPWAEDHFQERVSGEPLNPPPSEAWWPFAVQGNQEHKNGQQFSHTYPERFWPKRAGYAAGQFFRFDEKVSRSGIRYRYGDLADVVAQLTKNPLTRQAYLPVWFPEDTGAVAGQRVPCTLGYRFLLRNGKCDVTYDIRSCDLLRHMPDDVYMACRLLQWVVGKLQGNGIDCIASSLIMNISSLHVFRGDYPRLQKMIEDWEEEETYGTAI
jgi:Thymidylate synthase